MKLAIWFIGANCVGKSCYATQLGEKLKIPVVYLDTVIDRINLGISRVDSYNSILKKDNNAIILDGIIPFTFANDMRIVKDILQDYTFMYVVVNPEYSDWKVRIERRINEHAGSKPIVLSEEEYKLFNLKLKRRVGLYLDVVSGNELEIITEEEIRNILYQHDGFTDVKWKQLKLDVKNKSILDLGCSSCQYQKYAFMEGASDYTGLDVNLSFLINPRAVRFDLNNLETWIHPADIVICTSVFHYIHDKEKFIKECSRLTKSMFVFEIPLLRGTGKRNEVGARGLYFQTADLIEEWISKYFANYEVVGESIIEDGSYRLIYKCYK